MIVKLIQVTNLVGGEREKALPIKGNPKWAPHGWTAYEIACMGPFLLINL